MAEKPTDATIIDAALTEPAAFAEIFDRHYDAIRDYLARRLPSGLAEELAAETFLIAFERRVAYRHEYPSARPWLFGIATNLISRHRRDERRRMAAYERAATDRLDEAIEEAGAALEASATRAELSAAITDLDPGDRDALLLQALAELTYPEISVALGIPVGTVKSRLHRARQQVAGVLAPEGANASG